MAYKYINPGYAKMFSNTAVQVTNETYSQTGVGFSNTSSIEAGGMLISEFDEAKDFWCKFDFYLPSYTDNKTCSTHFHFPSATTVSRSSIRIYVMNADRASINLTTGYSLVDGSFALLGLKAQEVNTLWLHVAKLNTSAPSFYVKLNNEDYQHTLSSRIVDSSNYSKTARLYSDREDVIFSNLIISDEEISPKEQVIIVPTKEIETDMTAETGGTYIATGMGQSLLMTPDVEALQEKYGTGFQVTGVAVAGNPAYRMEQGVGSLIGVSKSGGSVTEHNARSLTQNTQGVVLDGWREENMTVEDLIGKQYGWKVGT